MAAVTHPNHPSINWQRRYVAAIAMAGSSSAVWAVANIWQGADFGLLVWLVLFALVSTAVSAISERAGMSFGISHAAILATAWLLGPAAGVLVGVIDSVGMWLIHSYQPRSKWKVSVEQLVFNAGMVSIAALLSGLGLTMVRATAGETLVGTVISWSVAAIVFDQINIWLVACVIYLQRGISPFKFWHQQRWAMPTNIAVAGVGGSLLVTGVNALGANGILLFALPLLLLAVPFRIYIRDTEAQLKQLEALNSELQQLGQRKDRMLAVLSHDMRSPLGVIKMAASGLERLPNLPPEKQTRMLRSILSSEAMLETLVNDIIDIEQVQMGKELELECVPVDLTALIVQVLETLQEQATEKGITLQKALPLQPLVVDGDMNKLLRVVLNLVGNALKYSDGSGRVLVDLRALDGQVALTVQDEGVGISADQLPHIFEPYFRSAEHKRFASGNGYGLAIVKAYVEAHGGTVTVDSIAGRGSTFRVTLPQWQSH